VIFLFQVSSTFGIDGLPVSEDGEQVAGAMSNLRFAADPPIGESRP
jgi:hypothetical protein